MPKTLQAERVLKGGREVSEQLTPETVKELVYLSSIECSLGWTPDEEQRVYHALPALLAAVRERDELKREVNDCRQIITTYADETELQQKRIAELEAERDSWRQQCEDRAQDVLRIGKRNEELEGQIVSLLKLEDVLRAIAIDGHQRFAMVGKCYASCLGCRAEQALKGGAK